MSTCTSGVSKGNSFHTSASVMPVAEIRWRGSTVSRSEWATTRPAVKNWLMVSKIRRSRPIFSKTHRSDREHGQKSSPVNGSPHNNRPELALNVQGDDPGAERRRNAQNISVLAELHCSPL